MKNILLIDPEFPSREHIKSVIAGEHHVMEAVSCDQALTLARERPVDLILLNMERADHQGPEICTRLKEEDATKSVPLILLSGFDQKENIVTGMHAGAEDYMTKPIYASELLARIDSHLRARDYYTDLEKDDLLMLLELTEAVSVTRNPRKILSFIVEKVSEAIGATRCSIIGLNDEGELTVKASNDLPANREIHIELDNYPEIQQALNTYRPVVLQDLASDPLMDSVREKIKGLEDHSIYVVPIIKKQNVIGTFFLRTIAPVKGSISPRVFKLCQLIADISGNALENAVLFETMQSSRKLLQDLAHKDSLTGLYNHQQFHTRFEEEFSRAKRYNLPLSCIFADIDDFKQVNDRFGHVVGDVVLKKLGELLQTILRQSDISARYGGEEFAIILPSTDFQGAEEFAERLRKMVRELSISHLKGDYVTVSVGVAAYAGNNVSSYEELLCQADQAMYTEKQGKKLSAPSAI